MGNQHYRLLGEVLISQERQEANYSSKYQTLSKSIHLGVPSELSM